MTIDPHIINLITSTKNSVDIFNEYLKELEELGEAKDGNLNYYIRSIIEAFHPENVTDEISRFCWRRNEEGDDEWIPAFGSIDIEQYKLTNGLTNKDVEKNGLNADLHFYWEDRKDREIREILEHIMSMGYEIPYWPYIRDPEYQHKIPHTVRNATKENSGEKNLKNKENSISTLTATERAMIIILLQDNESFPEPDQFSPKKPYTEFISQLLQINFETYDSGRKKAEELFGKNVTDSQKPTLKKYLSNIRKLFEIMEHQQILSDIDSRLSKLE